MAVPEPTMLILGILANAGKLLSETRSRSTVSFAAERSITSIAVLGIHDGGVL